MSNYTAVNVPPQEPERVVYPHEIVPPRESEVSKPSPIDAAGLWLETHRKVPQQAGVL